MLRRSLRSAVNTLPLQSLSFPFSSTSAFSSSVSSASSPDGHSDPDTLRAIARKHLPPALFHVSDIVAGRAEGSYVYEASTHRRFLDFTTGIGVTNAGHCPPTVVQAIQDQAAKFIHAQQNVFAISEPVARLCSTLARITPPRLDQFLFVNSGSEAVENAIKVARAATKRQNIVAFSGGYHGRTYGAMAVTSSKYIYGVGFGPLMPGVCISGYPYCLHCPGGGRWVEAPGTCCGAALENLEWKLMTQSAPQVRGPVITLIHGNERTPPPIHLPSPSPSPLPLPLTLTLTLTITLAL